jgi:CBS domain-containing protein
MKHRTVAAVMTPAAQVVSVHGGTGYKEIARLLAEHRISAVPVLDATSHVVGIVSEADLLAKESLLEDGQDRLPLFMGAGTRATRTKAAARSAIGLMTSPVVTIGPDEDVVQAARLLQSHRIKRLPVTDPQGRLLGIVSRRDILRLFSRQDQDIRHEVREDILLKMLWVDPESVEVTVVDGIVHLHGEVANRSLAELIGSVVRRTDGVVDVVSNLTFGFDDSEVDPQERPFHGIFEGRRWNR